MQEQQQLEINIDLSTTTPVLTNSGGRIWTQGFLFQRVSKFLTGASQDGVMPIQIFYDSLTGEIFEGAIPQELLKDIQSYNNSLLENDNSTKEDFYLPVRGGDPDSNDETLG